MSAGIRNPARQAGIAFAIFAAGAAGVAWGLTKPGVLTDPEGSPQAGALGLGLLAAIIGFIFFLNFCWGVRKVRALRAGRGVIARWTVTPATFDAFRKAEEARRKAGDPNDYRPPKRTPPGGVEVIFGPDAVLIGDWFHGLASSGIAHVREVGMAGAPAALFFRTAMTTGRTTSSGGARFWTVHGDLRIPAAPTRMDEAAKVIEHYRMVLAGRRLVNPDFWSFRIRLGLWAALVCGLVAAAGFALAERNQELMNAPLFMAVAGTIVGIGGLVMALIAWRFRDRQRRGWGR